MTPRIANIANISRADKRSPDNQDGPLWYADPTGEQAVQNMRGVCVIYFENSPDLPIYVEADDMKLILRQYFVLKPSRKRIRAHLKRAA